MIQRRSQTTETSPRRCDENWKISLDKRFGEQRKVLIFVVFVLLFVLLIVYVVLSVDVYVVL